jgi:hypothetical protein
VVLFNRQVERLDRLSRAARRSGGKAMTRAEIIRALIDALIASRTSLADHNSEAALRTYVGERLGAKGRRHHR